MKVPHTVFSTELRGEKRLLKARLGDLLAPAKGRGGGAGAALAEPDGGAHPDPHRRRLRGKWAKAVTFPTAPAIYR